MSLRIRGRDFIWGQRTYLMGILNVTPDSFSDGGEFATLEAAITQGRQLEAAGADIIDIGGQSTRPGAVQISREEELQRIIPVIEAVRQESSLPISVDTTWSQIAQKAVEAGADMVNDISGGTFDPNMFATVAQLGVPYILMHIRGTPATMQQLTDYTDLMGEIRQFFQQQREKAIHAGVKESHLILDPGIGFAKTVEQNITLFKKLPDLQGLKTPILLGPSRKSFIGKILNQNDPKQRVWGTAAACCRAIAAGVDILRVHDVGEMVEVCKVADALWR